MKTWVTQCGEGTSVVFQVIELEKQSFVYVGLENDSRLDSACLAMPMRQGSPVSTTILSKQELNPESKNLSLILCKKTGRSIIASYNIPPQAVSESVKQEIFAACIQGLMS